jgi:hypothetical protein
MSDPEIGTNAGSPASSELTTVAHEVPVRVVRNEIARQFPEWDLLPPSTIIPLGRRIAEVPQ